MLLYLEVLLLHVCKALLGLEGLWNARPREREKALTHMSAEKTWEERCATLPKYLVWNRLLLPARPDMVVACTAWSSRTSHIEAVAAPYARRGTILFSSPPLQSPNPSAQLAVSVKGPHEAGTACQTHEAYLSHTRPLLDCSYPGETFIQRRLPSRTSCRI